MLPKRNRANTKSIEQIFREGKFVNSPLLTFKYILTGSSTTPQISFIASKNIAKLAVKRNLLRRRGYSALKKYLPDFPLGLTGAFIFRKYIDNVSILENEIKNLLHKMR